MDHELRPTKPAIELELSKLPPMYDAKIPREDGLIGEIVAALRPEYGGEDTDGSRTILFVRYPDGSVMTAGKLATEQSGVKGYTIELSHTIHEGEMVYYGHAGERGVQTEQEVLGAEALMGIEGRRFGDGVASIHGSIELKDGQLVIRDRSHHDLLPEDGHIAGAEVLTGLISPEADPFAKLDNNVPPPLTHIDAESRLGEIGTLIDQTETPLDPTDAASLLDGWLTGSSRGDSAPLQSPPTAEVGAPPEKIRDIAENFTQLLLRYCEHGGSNHNVVSSYTELKLLVQSSADLRSALPPSPDLAVEHLCYVSNKDEAALQEVTRWLTQLGNYLVDSGTTPVPPVASSQAHTSPPSGRTDFPSGLNMT